MKNLFKIGEVVVVENKIVIIIAIDKQEKYIYWAIQLLTQDGENGEIKKYFENQFTNITINKDAVECMTNGKKRISMVRKAEKAICGHPVHNYPKTVDN